MPVTRTLKSPPFRCRSGPDTKARKMTAQTITVPGETFTLIAHRQDQSQKKSLTLGTREQGNSFLIAFTEKYILSRRTQLKWKELIGNTKRRKGSARNLFPCSLVPGDSGCKRPRAPVATHVINYFVAVRKDRRATNARQRRPEPNPIDLCAPSMLVCVHRNKSGFKTVTPLHTARQACTWSAIPVRLMSGYICVSPQRRLLRRRRRTP